MIRVPFFLHELLEDELGIDSTAPLVTDVNISMTYGLVRTRAMALATRLKEAGIVSGDRVLLALDGSRNVAVAIFSLSAIGAIGVPVVETESLVAMRRIVEVVRPSAMITDEPIPALLPLNKELGIRVLSSVANLDVSEWPPWGDAIDVDPALIMMTSGTSKGVPKGVSMSHNAIIGACESIARYLNIRSSDRILMTSPISFDYGLYQLIIGALRGAHVVLPTAAMRRFSVTQLDYISLHKITVLPLVPGFAKAVLPLWRRLDRPCPDVRLITFTGGAYPEEIEDHLIACFPNAQIIPMYGLTEAKRVAYLSTKSFARKPASIGRPIPNCRVRVQLPDGSEARTGEIGELYVQSRTIMNTYFDDPSATAERLSVSNEGIRTLRTGDQGYRDSDGDLFWMGRDDDVVKVDDVRVSTKEVEALLRGLPLIRDVAIVPIGLGTRLQLGAGVVPTTKGLAAADLLREIREKTGIRQMMPAKLALLDALPLTTHGKIDYREVSRILNAGATEDQK